MPSQRLSLNFISISYLQGFYGRRCHGLHLSNFGQDADGPGKVKEDAPAKTQKRKRENYRCGLRLGVASLHQTEIILTSP